MPSQGLGCCDGHHKSVERATAVQHDEKGTDMRVLLIEDDSATARSIELMLRSEGFNF
jgi:two-component system cell cycle response regulator CtrA